MLSRGGERVMRTAERPAHVAKNRLNLPDEFPLDWRIYEAFARGDAEAAQRIIAEYVNADRKSA